MINVLTCCVTANTGILRMATVCSVAVIVAINQPVLSSSAGHIIQNNWASPLTIVGTGVGNGI